MFYYTPLLAVALILVIYYKFNSVGSVTNYILCRNQIISSSLRGYGPVVTHWLPALVSLPVLLLVWVSFNTVGLVANTNIVIYSFLIGLFVGDQVRYMSTREPRFDECSNDSDISFQFRHLTYLQLPNSINSVLSKRVHLITLLVGLNFILSEVMFLSEGMFLF